MYNNSITPFLFIPFIISFCGNWYIFSGVQQEINAKLQKKFCYVLLHIYHQ